jgi:hypothetical protein
VPWNIHPLLSETDLILASKYTKSGSAPCNRPRHVGLDQLAEDGPEQQWQGCDRTLGMPTPRVPPPLALLCPMGSWLGLGSVPRVCWPICACWFGLIYIFPLLYFGPNVILCFFYSFGLFVVYFHINPAKQVKHQNLWNILVESPIY